MDPFAVIMLGGTALLVIALMLIGAFHPRSGADVLQWRPTRSPEVEAQNEIDDVEQMLEAANERRRARGLPDRTIEDIERSMREQRDAQQRHHEAYMADQEIDQLLALKNERRARRGLPPLTREEYEAQLRKS
ncbi:MAG TPA: hypothetical protein VGJ32_13400 [Solirubrobacteraceae bacterium]